MSNGLLCMGSDALHKALFPFVPAAPNAHRILTNHWSRPPGRKHRVERAPEINRKSGRVRGPAALCPHSGHRIVVQRQSRSLVLRRCFGDGILCSRPDSALRSATELPLRGEGRRQEAQLVLGKLTACVLTIRSSGRVISKAPVATVSVRAAQLNR